MRVMCAAIPDLVLFSHTPDFSTLVTVPPETNTDIFGLRVVLTVCLLSVLTPLSIGLIRTQMSSMSRDTVSPPLRLSRP